MKAKNNKTGDIYLILTEGVNATNSSDGELMTIYMNLSGDIFVREKSEFQNKFAINYPIEEEKE